MQSVPISRLNELPPHVRNHICARRIDACWLWTGALNHGGYGRARVGGRHYQAHRYVYREIASKIPDELLLDHTCGNRACCNPAHLEPVTNTVNIRRGRATRLSRLEANAIRMARGTQLQIAQAFGVSRQLVSDIRLGKAWRDEEAA